uniref:hypothetical protein n=1 Tax=Lachnoclostridium phocaeense TaxID=1871021 RepID=UPI0026DAC0AC|nr:hypothetical protein [Lachnoclostridium phocaeense]
MKLRNVFSGAVLLVLIFCLLSVVWLTFPDQCQRFFWAKKNEIMYVIGEEHDMVCKANALSKKYEVPISTLENIISNPSSYRVEEKDGKLNVIYREKTVKSHDGSYKLECDTIMSYPKR